MGFCYLVIEVENKSIKSIVLKLTKESKLTNKVWEIKEDYLYQFDNKKLHKFIFRSIKIDYIVEKNIKSIDLKDLKVILFDLFKSSLQRIPCKRLCESIYQEIIESF